MQYGFYSNTLLRFPPYENYKCNDHGFRTHEFDDWSNYCLVLGESNVFGIDVPTGKTVCELLEQEVKQKIYNLGQPGASCEECVRILYSFGETPPPKKVIMIWPYFLRRNHQSCNNSGPIRITGSREKELTKHIVHNTDEINISYFLQQVFFAEQWCAWRSTELYHFLVSKADSEMLQKHAKVFERLYLHSFENHAKDLGDDGGHFGRSSHYAFAQYIKNSVF